MEQAFKRFDKNDDGRITKDELKEVIKDMGVEPSEEELDTFMKQVDTDGENNQSHKHFCSEWCIVRYMNLFYSAVY